MTKKHAELPKIWNIVEQRQFVVDTPFYRNDEEKERYIKAHLKDFEKKEEKALYSMGFVKIPRSLIMSEEYQKLSPATKTILLWLLVKREIIIRKSLADISDKETKSLPWIIANDTEMAFYTNIDITNVKRTAAQLQEAGLVEIKREKTGNRKITVQYKLREWLMDSLGYFPLPLKTIVTPAWISLGHNSKQLYLILLSANAFAHGRTGGRFLVIRRYYSYISTTHKLSTRTISNAMKELESHGFLYITHGNWVKGESKKSDNEYMLSIEFLWEDKDTAFGLKESLAYDRKENSERYKKGGNRRSKEESDIMWEHARRLIAEHLEEKRQKELETEYESEQIKKSEKENAEAWDALDDDVPFL